MEIVEEAQDKESEADRQKDPHRGVQGADLGDDHEKPHPVVDDADPAFSAGPSIRLDRHVPDAFAVPQNAQGHGGGIGIGVGEQVDVAFGDLRLYGPEPRREVFHPELGHIGGEPVVGLVAQGTLEGGLSAHAPFAHHHVVVGEEFEHPGDILRLVLAVSVHEHENLPRRQADAALDSGPVSHVVGMGVDLGTGGMGLFGGVVGRAVVDDEDLEVRVQGADPGNDIPDGLPFIAGRNDDRYSVLHPVPFLVISWLVREMVMQKPVFDL